MFPVASSLTFWACDDGTFDFLLVLFILYMNNTCKLEAREGSRENTSLPSARLMMFNSPSHFPSRSHFPALSSSAPHPIGRCESLFHTGQERIFKKITIIVIS